MHFIKTVFKGNVVLVRVDQIQAIVETSVGSFAQLVGSFIILMKVLTS